MSMQGQMKIYAELQSLSGKKDRSFLQRFVENTNIEELSKVVCNRTNSADIVSVLNNVMQSYANSEASQVKKRKLVESIVRTLSQSKTTTSRADEIILCIASDFPRYSKQHLVKLVEFCIENIYTTEDEWQSWKDLLPALLEILEQEKYINYKNSEISGAEYKSLIVDLICNSNWKSNVLPPLAKMFGDMSLSKTEHDAVIRALCHKVPSLALNEIPPFVHHAFRLCSNHCCKLLIETLRVYFASRYTEAMKEESSEEFESIGMLSLKEVQNTESTVLYHIYQAGQLNYKSIRHYLEFLKKTSTAPEIVLEPFIVAVLLLLSSIYEDQILEILQQAIARNIQDEEKCKRSAWLCQLMPKNCNVMNVIEQVINNSDNDRHLVLKGIMDVAFMLMATGYVTKPDEVHLWEIGLKMLKKLMKKRQETGVTILQMLIDKIVASGVSISQYTDCLTYMCDKLTLTILDCQIWIITLIDQLLCIPGNAAVQILYAILPLIRVSPNVRDNLTLALRKSLYRKGTPQRQMAVIGFLEMLKNLKMSARFNLSASQCNNSATCPIGSSSSSVLSQITLERCEGQANVTGYHTSLCHDVLGILKKCFTQEVEVRLSLYEGLYDVVLKNSEISEYILEMLMAHFNLYFEPDENVIPPLRLDLCTDINGAEAILREPIAELILIIQKIYIKTASKNTEVHNRVAIILESLCKRMIQTELEHLNLDEDTNLLDNVPKSQQKLQNVKLMIKIYEASMSFKINAWFNDDQNMAKDIYHLFQGYGRMVNFLKRVTKVKKGEGKNKKNKDANNTTIKKTNRSTVVKLPSTIMDLDALLKILRTLHLESVAWTTHAEADSLKMHWDFCHYILQTCTQHVQEARLSKGIEFEKHKNQNLNVYVEIAGLLYKHAIPELHSLFTVNQQEALLLLEYFKEFFNLLRTESSSQLQRHLCKICEVESSAGLNLQLQTLISTFKTNLKMCLSEETEENTFSKQILSTLLEIVEHLIYKINFQEPNSEKVLEWMEKFAQMEDIDPAIASFVLRLTLSTEESSKVYGEVLYEMSMELSSKSDMIHKIDINASEKYKIIHEGTALQAYTILNNCIKEKLNNASWLLVKLKAKQNKILIENIEEEKDNIKKTERSLCKQLSYIIQILHILANITVDPGHATDLMFKNLQHLYNLLSNLTKYFCGKSTSQNPAFEAAKFIQVVQLAGKPLKSTFYNLITHIEESQGKKKKKIKSDTHAQRNNVLKETKIIPRVIFEIEHFNKEILLLEKRTGVPLENYIKYSVTRDFRILGTQLANSLEKADVSMLNTQNSHSESILSTTKSIANNDTTVDSDD